MTSVRSRSACDQLAVREREGGFTLIELLLVMTLVGVLASVWFTAHTSIKERSLRVEADAAWQELSTFVNLYHMKYGEWPQAHASLSEIADDIDVKLIFLPMGALKVNLAPDGPTKEQPTGYLVLSGGKVCAWVAGYAARFNAGEGEACPSLS